MIIGACAHDAGALFIDVRSRNYEAEAARDSRLDAQEERLAKESMTKTERTKERRAISAQRGKPIYKYTPSLIGTLAGQPFFLTAAPAPHTQIPALIVTIERALLDLSTDQPNTSKLRAQLRSLDSALTDLLAQIATLSALPDALFAPKFGFTRSMGQRPQVKRPIL
jgi:hypothetical protein